jgi:hypothetical protein
MLRTANLEYRNFQATSIRKFVGTGSFAGFFNGIRAKPRRPDEADKKLRNGEDLPHLEMMKYYCSESNGLKVGLFYFLVVPSRAMQFDYVDRRHCDTAGYSASVAPFIEYPIPNIRKEQTRIRTLRSACSVIDRIRQTNA